MPPTPGGSVARLRRPPVPAHTATFVEPRLPVRCWVCQTRRQPGDPWRQLCTECQPTVAENLKRTSNADGPRGSSVPVAADRA